MFVGFLTWYIGAPKLCSLLSVEQFLILEDVVQSLLNTCLYDVCSLILTEKNTQGFDLENKPFKGLFTPWTIKLSHVRGRFYMVSLLWSNFKNCILKAFGPHLGVNQIWTKKSDHASKSGCADFLNTCPKRAIFRIFLMFYILPFFTPSLSLLSS